MGNIFVDKLIAINQNPSATHSIIRNLMKQSRTMEEKVFRTLKVAIHGANTQHVMGPFLRVASQVFCRFSAQPDLVEHLISHVSQQCNNLQGSEGKAFLDFHKEVSSELFENPNFPADKVLSVQYDNIVEWAPGLLGYFETDVATETEVFLHEVLFKHARSPAHHGVAEDGDVPAGKVIDVARDLGLRCLAYLRDTYVLRRAEVSTRLVACLERTIKECGKFYNLRESPEDERATEFIRLSATVLEPLRILLVEDLEEESEWEGSSGSEQLTFEDVSVPIAGELHVGELQ